MKAIVVYESMFGNTEQVARAIGEGLASFGDVQVVEVGAAPSRVDDADLLVIGGPTHAFGMSRPTTREEAQKQTGDPVVSQTSGVREWLEDLTASAPVWVAAFDTKVFKARKLRGAARGVAKSLRKHAGVSFAAEVESFYVADTRGPLLEGELDRAVRWAERLGEHVVTAGLAV